jgi:hypothetical protein
MILKSPIQNQIGQAYLWSHIDFSREQTIEKTGSRIVSVLNLSGNKIGLSQTVSSSRPQTGIVSHNGLNVASFDGTKFLNFNDNSAGDVPFTVFVVGLNESSGSISRSFIGRQTSTISGQWVIFRQSSDGVFNAFGHGVETGFSQATKAGNNNANIHNITFADGQGITYRLNNDSPATGVVKTGQDNTITTGLCLGAKNPAGGNPLMGWIGELIIYTGVLSTPEIAMVNQYLSNKWGIAIV